jgi:hypothetical protein
MQTTPYFINFQNHPDRTSARHSNAALASACQAAPTHAAPNHTFFIN